MRSAIVDAHIGDLFKAPVGVVPRFPAAVRECWINVHESVLPGMRVDMIYGSRRGADHNLERARSHLRLRPLYRIHVIPKVRP